MSRIGGFCWRDVTRGGKGGGRKGKGLRRGGVVIMELWRGWNNKWISGGGLVVPHWRILLA